MLCYKREANLQTEDLLVSQQNLLAATSGPQPLDVVKI